MEHLIHHLLSSGHGIRKIVNQNRYDIATELICSAFRTSWGLESDNWRNLCPEISLKDLVDGDQVCQQFLEEGFLELVPEEYLKLSERERFFLQSHTYVKRLMNQLRRLDLSTNVSNQQL